MKHLKKLLSAILVMAMALTMALPAAAADNNTLTINAKTVGHQYEAYQVFAGKISDNKLVDITWGDGVNGEALLTALKTETFFEGAFAEATDAAGVAKALDGQTDKGEFANKFAEIVSKNLTEQKHVGTVGDNKVCTITGLPDGYYFVKDGTVSTGDTYTKFILWVTENQTVTAKTDVPMAEKKVQENTKYPGAENPYGTGYNDVADYNIGDTVPFSFYSKVPDMSNFKSYKYIFHDVMSAGLTFNDDVKVTIGGTDVTASCEVKETNSGFDVIFADLKQVAGITTGQEIRIDFRATLNTSAEIGLPGNPNTMTLEYSNNPNDETQTTTGTPDTVIVFTYELDVTKVDGATLGNDGAITDATKKLEGVQFKLKNSDGKYVIISEEAATEGKVKGWSDTEDGGSVLTTAAGGKFAVIGLDDGIYYLEETKPLDGYNTIKDPIKVTISAETENGQNWTDGTAANALTALNITVGEGDKASTTGGAADTGIVSTIVENNKGVELPGTGGIGTTIFYVVGGILVVGAAVLLIAKKRTK